MKSSKLYDYSVFSLAFLTLSCGFVWRGSASIAAVLLAVIGISSIFRGGYFKICWKNYWPWVMAMSGIGLAIAIRQFIDLDFRMRFADSAARLMLAIPIFAAVCQTRLSGFNNTRWAVFLAIPLMLIFGYFQSVAVDGDRIHTAFTNTIPYSAFCLVFGVSFFIYSYRLGGWSRGAAVIAMLGTILMLYLSQSRGVWIAAIFSSLFVFSTVFGFSWKRFFTFLIVLFGALVLLYIFSGVVHGRVNMAVAEYHEFFMGNRHGSIGERLSMALASYYLFESHPWFGVGRDISPALHLLYQKGLVISQVINATDTHGELFFNAASLGVVGLVCYIVFYVGGSFPYWKAVFSRNEEVAVLGKIGLAVNVIYFFVGFTHVTLGLVMYASIYAVFQGVLLASLYKANMEDSTLRRVV